MQKNKGFTSLFSILGVLLVLFISFLFSANTVLATDCEKDPADCYNSDYENYHNLSDSNKVKFFTNIYFLTGIFIAILIKSIILYHKDLMKLKEKQIKQILIFFLIFFGITYIQSDSIISFIQSCLITLSLLIFIIIIFHEIKKEEEDKSIIFRQINITNLFIPVFIIIYFFYNKNLSGYIFLLLLFLLLIFLSNNIPSFLENLFYPVYLIFFIIAFVVLNFDLFTKFQIFLAPYTDHNLSPVFLILGIVVGYLYFLIGIYLMFLMSYFPGRREVNYFDRIEKRFKFIAKQFKNKLNMPVAIFLLFLIFLLFVVDIYYIQIPLSFFLFFFLTLDNVFFKISNKDVTDTVPTTIDENNLK